MRSQRKVILAGLSGLALAVACQPLKQPLGSIAPLGSTGGAGTGPTGMCSPGVLRCFQDPALSPSSPVSGQFSGSPNPDPAATPVIVYPLSGSLHPINLGDITFQWRRGPDAAQTLFRIRLKRLSGDAFEYYVPCNHVGTDSPVMEALECVYHMPPAEWLDLATTVHGETLSADVTGVDPTRPGIIATSDPITISFSPEPVSGGIYYWTTSIQGAMRLPFGGKATPWVVQNSPANPYTCSGCHAVSRGGATTAYTEGMNVDGFLRVVSATDASKPLFPSATAHDSGMSAISPDGTLVLTSFSNRLVLRDAATGATLSEVPAASLGTRHGYHPEWSPDGRSLAITLAPDASTDVTVRAGAIGVLPYDPTATGNAAWGTVDELVPSGTEFNFYPTWSPDGHWIAFATAPVSGGATPTTSYAQPQARLRLVNRDTRTVFELANATFKPGRTSTYPKFAPVAQSGGLMFLTFNSKLDYGFFSPTGHQLWITSIDPNKIPTGDDPSTVPVWLPFQSPKERNYLGVWTERIACRAEGTGISVGCGVNEVCSNGACVMVTP
jgi:hypothetical protein